MIVRDVVMRDGVKVSVVIPYYNAASYISRAIESLLSQTYQNIEIIAVDDFSTDCGRAVVDELSARDSRVRSITSQTKGANWARHAGVSHSSGDYIAFLDSDDTWRSDAMRSMLDIALRKDVDIVCCNVAQFSESNEKKLLSFARPGVVVKIKEEPYSLLELPPMVCGKLFRAEVLRGFQFESVPFAQDWNICYKAAAHASSVFFLDECLYSYIRRDSSVSSLKKVHGVSALKEAERSILGIVDYYAEVGASSILGRPLFVVYCLFYLDLLLRSFRIEDKNDRCKVYQMISGRVRFFEVVRALSWSLGSKNRRRLIFLGGALPSFFFYEFVRGLSRRFGLWS